MSTPGQGHQRAADLDFGARLALISALLSDTLARLHELGEVTDADLDPLAKATRELLPVLEQVYVLPAALMTEALVVALSGRHPGSPTAILQLCQVLRADLRRLGGMEPEPGELH